MRRPAEARRSSLETLPVPEYLARRVMARNAGHAAARMGRGAALVEAADRRAVVGPVWHRALPEELIGTQLTVKDMSLWKANDPLQVRRYQELEIDDLPGEARRHLVDDRERRAREIRLFLRPVGAVLQRVRRVPAENVDHVLSRRRQRIVDDGRHHGSEER